MKPQTKLTLALVTAYSLFMLWWFLREDAPKLGTPQTAAVSATSKDKKVEAVASVGSSKKANSRLPLRGEAKILEFWAGAPIPFKKPSTP